jgi:Icc-related predicted phosphoesterase
MLIRATSDFHGTLPEIEPCDLLLIGGDVTPNHNHRLDFQLEWLDTRFRDWLARVPATRIVGIAGNHDFIFEQAPHAVDGLGLPWVYLEDEMMWFDGLSIYGTPWVPNLPRWAFYGGPENRVSMTKIEGVPEGVDILLSHGPMHGYGDHVSPMFGDIDVGCRNMAEAMPRIKPRAFVCGHIHEGYGHYRHPDIEMGVFNVAYNDERYRPVNAAVQIEL